MSHDKVHTLSEPVLSVKFGDKGILSDPHFNCIRYKLSVYTEGVKYWKSGPEKDLHFFSPGFNRCSPPWSKLYKMKMVVVMNRNFRLQYNM